MKIRRILLLILALGCLLSHSACEKLWLEPDPPADPESVFNYLWEDVNARYALFEVKEIDWQAIGQAHRSRLSPDMGDHALFGVLSDMLYELKDGHVNLTSSFDRSRNWDWFLDFPVNYNQNVVDRNYLGRDFRITGPLHNQILHSVLYVNYRSFGDDISHAHLDQLMLRAEGMSGVIIDVRNNGGGSLQNAQRLASCFTDKPYAYAHERIKTGPGFNDFSVWRDLVVSPRQGRRFGGQVVVLVNRKSYSATSFFAQMMRVLPNAVLMGDQTGGGGGVPAFGELPNGWKYRFSATQTLTPEGNHVEMGVPVDYPVGLDEYDEQMGIDTMIEAALDWLR
ncbi:MAG: S41 family peptidase [Bacteroidales bacterium]